MTDAALLEKAHHLLVGGKVSAADALLQKRWPVGLNAPAKALHLFGIVRQAQGRAKDAEHYFRNALANSANVAADDAEVLNNLGGLYLSAGALDAARQCFAEALKRDASLRAARLNLARAAIALRDPCAAEAAMLPLTRSERSSEVLGALATSLMDQHRNHEALAVADEALALAPDASNLREARAELLLRLGEQDKALACRKVLAEQDGPGQSRAIHNYAATLNHCGQIDRAIAVLDQAVRERRRDALLHSLLAKYRWLHGDDNFAGPMLDVLTQAPDDLEMLVACADLLEMAGKAEQAHDLVQEGLHRAPNAGPLLRTLGVLSMERGDVAEAIEAFTRAYAQTPSESVATLLANALLRAGDARAASPLIALGLQQARRGQAWLALDMLEQRISGKMDVEREVEALVTVIDLAPPAGWSSIEAFNRDLAERLDALHFGAAHPLDQSLREGTQRDVLWIKDELVQAFLALAKEAVRARVSVMPNAPQHPFFGRRRRDVVFSGAWSVRLRAEGHHINHIHSAGWISSAYYVRLPPMAPADAPHAGWLKFGEPRLPVPGCGPVKWVEPKPGRLVLFPSYLWHGTAPFSAGDRLTVAFDIVPI